MLRGVLLDTNCDNIKTNLWLKKWLWLSLLYLIKSLARDEDKLLKQTVIDEVCNDIVQVSKSTLP